MSLCLLSLPASISRFFSMKLNPKTTQIKQLLSQLKRKIASFFRDFCVKK